MKTIITLLTGLAFTSCANAHTAKPVIEEITPTETQSCALSHESKHKPKHDSKHKHKHKHCDKGVKPLKHLTTIDVGGSLFGEIANEHDYNRAEVNVVVGRNKWFGQLRYVKDDADVDYTHYKSLGEYGLIGGGYRFNRFTQASFLTDDNRFHVDVDATFPISCWMTGQFGIRHSNMYGDKASTTFAKVGLSTPLANNVDMFGEYRAGNANKEHIADYLLTGFKIKF